MLRRMENGLCVFANAICAVCHINNPIAIHLASVKYMSNTVLLKNIAK